MQLFRLSSFDLSISLLHYLPSKEPRALEATSMPRGG